MAEPLYATTGEPWSTRSQSPAANLGLVFDKFYDGWNSDFTDHAGPLGNSKSPKLDWIEKIVARQRLRLATVDGPEHEFASRQRTLAAALGGETWEITTTARLVTGTGIANPIEVGFAWHHTAGCPYLPGSGLKGALKSYWRDWVIPELNDPDSRTEESRRVDRIFGVPGRAGDFVMLDVLPANPIALAADVMTPHYSDWYMDGAGGGVAPGDWMSPTIIPFLVIEQGARLQVSIVPTSRARATSKTRVEDIFAIQHRLMDALLWTGLGAKTAVGYGRATVR